MRGRRRSTFLIKQLFVLFVPTDMCSKPKRFAGTPQSKSCAYSPIRMLQHTKVPRHAEVRARARCKLLR